MFLRICVALIGAVVITTGLLLGMDAVTDVFRERSSEKMYRISDVIRRDRSGRPDLPEPPTRLPALPDAEPEPTRGPVVIGESPAAPDRVVSPPLVLEPALDSAQESSPDD